MVDHKAIRIATYVLVIIGALNWGIIGVLGVNFVNVLLGGSPVVEKILYILVGASAVYDIIIARDRRTYGKKKK